MNIQYIIQDESSKLQRNYSNTNNVSCNSPFADIHNKLSVKDDFIDSNQICNTSSPLYEDDTQLESPLSNHVTNLNESLFSTAFTDILDNQGNHQEVCNIVLASNEKGEKSPVKSKFNFLFRKIVSKGNTAKTSCNETCEDSFFAQAPSLQSSKNHSDSSFDESFNTNFGTSNVLDDEDDFNFVNKTLFETFEENAGSPTHIDV